MKLGCRIAMLGALLSFTTIVHAASIEAWQEEFPSLIRAIRSTHPHPFTRIGEGEFMRQANALLARLPRLSEEQRIAETMRLVAELGEGHTWVEPHGAAVARWYPIRLYQFSDGVFVTSAHRSVRELAGAQILDIAGQPAATVLDRARTLLGADNRFGAMENLHAISNAGLMRALGIADASGALPLRIRERNGRIRSLRLAPLEGRATFDWKYRSEPFGLRIGETEDWISAYGLLPATAFRDQYDPARPPHLRNRNYFHGGSLAGQDAYYIQVNFFSDRDDESFVQFFQRALREVDQMRPRRLIVDWRYNSGGDGSKVIPMIHEFIRRGDDPPWRELYVLVGRKTFSAAIDALDAFREHLRVTFVGEPAGAAFNAFGDAVDITFPRTELELHVSTARHVLTNDWEMNPNDPYVTVDVPAQFSFVDYVAGRDPALDPILHGEEMRSLPIIIGTDGLAAARRVYDERRRRYAAYDWWRAADRRGMSQAFYALMDQHRTAEALDVALMNTEINPEVWNSWGNLAEAYMALGRREEAIAAYRRSMQIAPHNEAVRSSGIPELQVAQ